MGCGERDPSSNLSFCFLLCENSGNNLRGRFFVQVDGHDHKQHSAGPSPIWLLPDLSPGLSPEKAAFPDPQPSGSGFPRERLGGWEGVIMPQIGHFCGKTGLPRQRRSGGGGSGERAPPRVVPPNPQGSSLVVGGASERAGLGLRQGQWASELRGLV